MDWCRSNCVGHWVVSDSIQGTSAVYGNRFYPESLNEYEFAFEDERDLILFELRWS